MPKTDEPAYEQFPPKVCERIRNLARYHGECEAERKRSFKERDMLKIRAAEADESEAERINARRAVTMDKIDELNAAMKWAVDEIKEVVFRTTTGEPLLFESPELEVPNFHAKALESAKKSVEKGAEDEETGGDGDEAEADSPHQLALAGTEADQAGDPPAEPAAEPEGDDAVIASMVPGVFKDQNAREYQIGDLAALQELVSNACGAKWYWRPVVSTEYGSSIVVSEEPGAKGPVLFTLRRTGDIPAPAAKPKTSKKPAAKKSAKRGKKAAAK